MVGLLASCAKSVLGFQIILDTWKSLKLSQTAAWLCHSKKLEIWIVCKFVFGASMCFSSSQIWKLSSSKPRRNDHWDHVNRGCCKDHLKPCTSWRRWLSPQLYITQLRYEHRKHGEVDHRSKHMYFLISQWKDAVISPRYRHVSCQKNLVTFHYTGCLIGLF